MAMSLNLAELKILRELREFGVLTDVIPELINQANGICILPCGDGDHFDDIYGWHKKLMLKQGLPTRIHVLSTHGGALVIPKESPLNVNSRGANLLEDIGNVPNLKGINTVASYAHAPCGAADLARLSVLQQIYLLKEADIIIQTRYPKLQALSFFQVFWGDRKKTYFVLGSKWREWLALHPNKIPRQ